MKLKNIKVEYKEGWALVKISRPKALNALNSGVLDELKKVIEELNNNEEVKVIAITGEGKAFVAGADIAEMKNMNSIEGREFAQKGHQTFNTIEESSKPIIAAINGFALGGGCELALSCDIRIASYKAQLGQPEITLGIIPGFGGTQRLAKVVGVAKTKELIFTGRNIKADEALEIGLVNKVVDPDELIVEVEKMATRIADKSPLILSLAKEAIDDGAEKEVAEGLKLETNLFGICFSTKDQKEGMDAFLNKRRAEFVGE